MWNSKKAQCAFSKNIHDNPGSQGVSIAKTFKGQFEETGISVEVEEEGIQTKTPSVGRLGEHNGCLKPAEQ